MTALSHKKQLSCFVSSVRYLLDDVIAPIVGGIPDLECREPVIKKNTVALDVPGVTQAHTYSCGATASWSVITSLGWKVSLRDWLKICHDEGMTPDEGMGVVEMRKALRRIGASLTVKAFRSRSQIERAIDAGQPVLFGWDDEEFADGDHWMYAYGYERHKILVGNVVLPTRSKAKVTWAEWERRLAPREIYLIQ